MDFGFSEEENSFRQEVRELTIKELPQGWAKRIFLPIWDIAQSEEVWTLHKRLARKFAERGWLAMGWPEEFGGHRASQIMNLIFQEESAYQGAPGRDPYGVGMLGPALLRFGTEEQKSRFLKPIAKGEAFWCEVLSEPDAGSDLGAIQIKAVEDGDSFIINGQKVWGTDAQFADWCFLIARTDPDAPKYRGISFFLVDLKTPGMQIRVEPTLSPIMDFNEIFFDDVRIPKENVVGGINQGWRVVMALLDFERSWIEPVAVSRRLLDELVEYLKESEDGSNKNPLIRQRLAEAQVKNNVARLLSYRVAWMQDNGLDCTSEASMCKVCSTEFFCDVCNMAMQMLGLYGQLREQSQRVPIRASVVRRCLGTFGWTLAGGTNEIMRNLIALRGLGLPRS